MLQAARALILPLDVVPTAARFSSSTQTLYASGENEDEKTGGRFSSLRDSSRRSDSRRASSATVSKHGVNATDPWGEVFCV